MPLGTGTTNISATPRPNIPTTAWGGGAASRINTPSTVNRGLGGVAHLPSQTNTRPVWGAAQNAPTQPNGFGQQLNPQARQLFAGFTPLQQIAFQKWIQGLNAQRPTDNGFQQGALAAALGSR